MPVIVEVDGDDLESLKAAVGATDEIAEKALVRALSRTIRWVNTRVRRLIAAEAGVPSGVVKFRLRMRLPTKGSRSASIWIGLNPVPAHRLKARQTRAGVTAGKHRFAGAFLAGGNSQRQVVFEREGRSRTPIRVVKIDIEEKARKAIEGRAWPEAERRLLDEFERQMRLGMQRRG